MSSESTKPRVSNRSTLFEKLSLPLVRRGIIAAALAGMIAPGLAGCYGSFPLTKAVYRFNGKLTNLNIVHSIVMIVLAFIGVYGITILIDAIIINLIEFWSGEDFSTAMTFDQPDGTVVVLAPGATSDELVMTLSRDGEVLETRRFLRRENGLIAVTDEVGSPVGIVRPTSDGFDLVDTKGETRDTISLADIASLRAAQPATFQPATLQPAN